MNTRFHTHIVLVVTVLFAMTAASGCQKQDPKADAFLEKWKAVQKQAGGHTPTYTAPKVSEQRRAAQNLEQPERPLPNRLVSLRMHRASLAGVLKALSRAGNQSVMLSPNIDGEVTVNIERKPWDQVFRGIVNTNGLAYRWEGDIIRVMTLEDMENDLKLAEVRAKQNQQKLRSKGDEPLQSEVIPIRYADADSLRKAVEQIIIVRDAGAEGDDKTHGYVTVDNSTNSLIVEAAFEDLKKIFNVVDKLDRPQKQVTIKAHIVEASNTVARDLGVRYGGWFRAERVDGTQNIYAQPAIRNIDIEDGEIDYDNFLGIGGVPFGWGADFLPRDLDVAEGIGLSTSLLYGVLGENVLEINLNALAQDNLIKILSSPSITTLDNKTGIIENGQRVPYAVSTADEINVEFEDVLLKLEITPHVIDDQFLRMSILVTQDSLNPQDVLGFPIIDKRLSQTSLIIRNRETVVISGLTLQRETVSTAGLPYVKDIPVLGWLAKGESKSDEGLEILVFLTPTILAEWQPGEIQESIEEVEQRIERERAAKEETMVQ